MPRARFRVCVFGGPILFRDEQAVPLSPLQGALLGILAAHRDEGAKRDRLLSFLWPSGTDDQLRPRLNQLAYFLQRRMGGGRVISLTGGRYVLNGHRVASDLDELAAALRDSDPVTAVDLVVRGFLSSLDAPGTEELERWIQERDLHFRAQVRALAAARSAEVEELGDWTAAEQFADASLRLSPSDESALRRCLMAKALAGKVREAEARYAGYRESALLADSAWKPGEETTSLLSQLEELASRAPALPELATQTSPDPPLVGRAEELAGLRAVLRGPTEDRFQTLVVTGERGIGKTRLVREALARTRSTATRVLEGRCSEFERNIPLSPLLGALSQPWIGRHVRSLPEPWRSLLLALLPEFSAEGAAAGAGLGDSPEDVPRATCEAFLRLLEILADGRRVVLVLDDLHWLDATSFSVLQYVRERWTQGGFLLIATIRPEELEREALLSRWLRGGLPGLAQARELPVGPLSVSEIALLMRSAIKLGTGGDADRAAAEGRVASLAESVGGHPLLAIECARHLVESTPDQWSVAERAGLSEAVSDIVRLRTSVLSAGARRLLQALSASAKPLPYSLVEKVCGLRSQDLAAPLDEVIRHQLLANSKRGIGFRHELLREAVYQDLDEGQRIAMHLRIADALIDHGELGTDVDVALHLLAAGEGRRANAHVLSAARTAISTGGWVEARSLLEAALENEPTPLERESLAAQLGKLLVLMGDFPRAQELWAVEEEEQRGRGTREAALTARLRRLEALFLDPSSDRGALRQTVSGLRKEAESLGLQKLVGESMGLEVAVLDRMTRATEVRDVTAEASALVGKGDADARLQFLLVSMVDAVYGNPTKAAAMADEAIALASDLGNPDLLLRAYNWKIIAY
ncbi:MAG: AAA family ATPase, partial [Gemmatimonadota bacterium]